MKSMCQTKQNLVYNKLSNDEPGPDLNECPSR